MNAPFVFEASPGHAAARDNADPLASFRDRFAHPAGSDGRPLIYLCGHSLGLQPLGARTIVLEELDRWATLGIEGQFREPRAWVGYAEHLRAGLSRLAGAQHGEVVAMNALTVNLHLLLASFYRPQGTRTRVLMEAGAFPSDRHAVLSQLALHGLDPATTLIELAPRAGESVLRTEDIEAEIERQGDRLALVFWPGVQYLTGQSFDCARLQRAASKVGAMFGLDLAHAIGNVPLALHEWNVDFAVWCSYKYLNAGPGAIGGAFVHERHSQRGGVPRLAGWWGHDPESRFQMSPNFVAASGAEGWQVSNPPILSSAPLLASLAIFDAAGIGRLRAKSIELTGYLEFLLARLPPGEVTRVTPAAPEERGCQLSLRIRGGAERGRRLFANLTEHGVVCDWREPDIIRVAPVPSYNTFCEVHAFSERLATALHATA